jgi:hypothetical protein
MVRAGKNQPAAAVGLTYLDGGDAEAAGLEHDADAAGRHALAEPAHHAARHQNVLHGVDWFSLSCQPLLLDFSDSISSWLGRKEIVSGQWRRNGGGGRKMGYFFLVWVGVMKGGKGLNRQTLDGRGEPAASLSRC